MKTTPDPMTAREADALALMLGYGEDHPGVWFAVEHVFPGPQFRAQRSAVARARARADWPSTLVRRESAGCWLYCVAIPEHVVLPEFPAVHGLTQLFTRPAPGQPGSLVINRELYSVEPLLHGYGCARVRVGYHLVKLATGAVRDVRWPLIQGERWQCSCEDRSYRRRPAGLCKHGAAVAALQEKGYLP